LHQHESTHLASGAYRRPCCDIDDPLIFMGEGSKQLSNEGSKQLSNEGSKGSKQLWNE